MESILSGFYNISAFIAVITVIVFVHEFGHYYIAKISGVKIEEFSIGMGREIFGFNDKSGTRWKICVLPIGGYVKMFGDASPASNPDSEKIEQFSEEEAKVAFHTKPLSIKSAIVFAGPLFNFLFAIMLLTILFAVKGKSVSTSEIGSVAVDSAAYQAGIKAGDVINDIDGAKISSFADIQRIVSINTGTEINISFTRDDLNSTVKLTPKFVEKTDFLGNNVKTPMLGVSSGSVKHNKLGIFSAFIASINETYNISTSTLKALGQMITGQRSIKEMSGPIGIAKYSGQSAAKGLTTITWFIIILSINLGLVNLFPIPILDGGHLFFYGIEAIKGSPVSEKVKQVAFKIGLALIGTFFIFAIFNDIQKLNIF